MHRLILGLTGLLGAVGATYLAAFLVFGGDSDRAASLVPADAVAYVNVYLQPSSGQQMQVAELIGRLPGFADDATLDEKVDQITQNLLAGTGIDYQADLKPWLGDQVAAAVWPAGDDPDTQRSAMVIHVKDRQAAEAALPRLATSLETGDTVEETHGGVVMSVAADGMTSAFVEEMLVVGDAPDSVRDVIDTAAGVADLAGLAQFRASRDRLPGDHLAFAFGNPTGLSASVSASGTDLEVDECAPEEGFGPVAAVLIADDDGLRITGSATVPGHEAGSSEEDGADAAADPAAVAEWMPADAAVAITLFDVAGMLADAEAAAGCAPGGQELTDALGAIRLMASFGLGVDLDTEVLPLLSREAAISFSGLDGDAPRAQLILRPEDPVAALATLDRIAEQLAEAGGETRTEQTAADVEIVTVVVPELGEVSYAGTGEVLILALSPEDVLASVQANGAGDTLAASEAYRRAFEVVGEAGTSRLYVDVEALVEGLGLAETLPADARDILARIGSLGLAVLAPQGDQIEFHAVLTIDGGAE